MIKRDSFRVYCEDRRNCIVSKGANRVLAFSAEAICISLTGYAQMDFIPATFVFHGVSGDA
jgi:hypothetical protein